MMRRTYDDDGRLSGRLTLLVCLGFMSSGGDGVQVFANASEAHEIAAADVVHAADVAHEIAAADVVHEGDAVNVLPAYTGTSNAHEIAAADFISEGDGVKVVSAHDGSSNEHNIAGALIERQEAPMLFSTSANSPFYVWYAGPRFLMDDGQGRLVARYGVTDNTKERRKQFVWYGTRFLRNVGTRNYMYCDELFKPCLVWWCRSTKQYRDRYHSLEYRVMRRDVSKARCKMKSRRDLKTWLRFSGNRIEYSENSAYALKIFPFPDGEVLMAKISSDDTHSSLTVKRLKQCKDYPCPAGFSYKEGRVRSKYILDPDVSAASAHAACCVPSCDSFLCPPWTEPKPNPETIRCGDGSFDGMLCESEDCCNLGCTEYMLTCVKKNMMLSMWNKTCGARCSEEECCEELPTCKDQAKACLSQNRVVKDVAQTCFPACSMEICCPGD